MEEKTCKNCKYFLRHYIYSKSNFYAINDGHCICKQKNFKLKPNCEHWESGEENKKERIENIEKTIRAMRKQLNYILEYLKNETIS